MAKTLFDHIKAVTQFQDPKYWDKLEEADKKTWSNYMVQRFLSMNPDWITTIADLEPFVERLNPEQFYLTMINVIPKGRHYLKYVKGKKVDKYEDFLIDLIKEDFKISKIQAEEYCEIIYATREGRENIKYICEKYGVDKKQITKLKLKI